METVFMTQVRHNRRTATWIGFDRKLTSHEIEVINSLDLGEVASKPRGGGGLSPKYGESWTSRSVNWWYRVRGSTDPWGLAQTVCRIYRPRCYGTSGFIHEGTTRLPRVWRSQAISQGIDLTKIAFY